MLEQHYFPKSNESPYIETAIAAWLLTVALVALAVYVKPNPTCRPRSNKDSKQLK